MHMCTYKYIFVNTYNLQKLRIPNETVTFLESHLSSPVAGTI